MKPTVFGSLLLWAAIPLTAQSSAPLDPGPLYVQSSIVNAASPKAEALAPNTLGTIFGQYLSRTTHAITQDEILAGALPTTLRGTGVRVTVGNILAPLIYVSPSQINFLVPPALLPGKAELRVAIDSRYGPAVQVRIDAVSPALFQTDPEFALATRSDGSVITQERPAKPGDTIVLYATGLGQTNPRILPGQLVREPASLVPNSGFRVELNGISLPAGQVLYAGLAPGFAGVYQINLKLPAVVDVNPVIQIGFGESLSPVGLKLRVQE